MKLLNPVGTFPCKGAYRISERRCVCGGGGESNVAYSRTMQDVFSPLFMKFWGPPIRGGGGGAES